MALSGALLTAAWLPACASSSPRPHPALARVWRDYESLPPARALALAGQLRRDRWVAGASGGHASPREAEAAALRECRKRRLEQRMQAPCLLYALGDEVVWPDR